MKILHTADWHLGKKLEKFSRLEEQKQVLEEISDLADQHQVDVVLIAGDLFDAFNPSSEAVDLFYRTLKRLSNQGRRPVIAIAGNHDSPDRIEAPDPLARECGILFAGYPSTHLLAGSVNDYITITKSEPGFIELRIAGFSYPLRVLLTPYANEYRLKTFLGLHEQEQELRLSLQQDWQRLVDQHCDASGVNVLMTHLFVMNKGTTPMEEPEDEKPILHIGGAQAIYTENIPDLIQYTAVGHLHRPHQVAGHAAPVVYSGSPLSYSFSEANQEKGVMLFEAKPGEAIQAVKIPLRSGRALHRKKFDDLEKALLWLQENPHTLVELTLISEDYMAADVRKKLHLSHDGIITIIPEVRNKAVLETKQDSLDLSLSIDELFVAYFQSKHGQNPNQEIKQLFTEIRAEQAEQ